MLSQVPSGWHWDQQAERRAQGEPRLAHVAADLTCSEMKKLTMIQEAFITRKHKSHYFGSVVMWALLRRIKLWSIGHRQNTFQAFPWKTLFVCFYYFLLSIIIWCTKRYAKIECGLACVRALIFSDYETTIKFKFLSINFHLSMAGLYHLIENKICLILCYFIFIACHKKIVSNFRF